MLQLIFSSPSCTNCQSRKDGSLSVVENFDSDNHLFHTFTAVTGSRGFQTTAHQLDCAKGCMPSSEFANVDYLVSTLPYHYSGTPTYDNDSFFEISPSTVLLPNGITRGGFGIFFNHSPAFGTGSGIFLPREREWRELLKILSSCSSAYLPLHISYRS